MSLVTWQSPPDPVVLISFDGFRWDYTHHIHTPQFDRLEQAGFRVGRMRPSWPSLTFSNHYTLVTGLEPARHGIVNNAMYDRKTGKTYDKDEEHIDSLYDGEWYTGKAIWEIAGNHGLKTASYYWIGSEVKGRTPDSFFPFDSNTTDTTKIAQLKQWLDPQTDPTPHFICIYFEKVDTHGHYDGIHSPQLIHAVKQADYALGRIMDVIQASKRRVNMLVTADHGMTPLNGEWVSTKDIKAAAAGNLEKLITHYSTIDLFLENPTPEKVTAVMKRLPQRPWLHWYRREDFPWPLHASRNGDIYGYTDSGFQVLDEGSKMIQGGHGYEPQLSDMGAICYGYGPAFEPGGFIEMARSVDVFPLLVHLLGLPPRSSDGSLEPWKPLLRQE